MSFRILHCRPFKTGRRINCDRGKLDANAIQSLKGEIGWPRHVAIELFEGEYQQMQCNILNNVGLKV